MKLLLLTAAFGIWGWAQQAPAPASAADHETRIAKLPPAEKAYERYRFWSTQQPPRQAPAELLKQYRVVLKQRGYGEAEIEEQIRLVVEQGNRSEVQRWNRMLTAEKPTFNTRPNDFLVEMTAGRKAGKALDVGMGQGRNAIWLAQQGWEVTGFDPANEAVKLAQKTAASEGVKITTEVATAEKFAFGDEKWDLILLSYVSVRELPEILTRALRPGGVVVVEGFHRDATKGRSIGGGVVFDTGELVKLFPGLRVVRYEEPVRKADFGQQMMRVVRYCAEKAAE